MRSKMGCLLLLLHRRNRQTIEIGGGHFARLFLPLSEVIKFENELFGRTLALLLARDEACTRF